jgi:hypothetical protein
MRAIAFASALAAAGLLSGCAVYEVGSTAVGAAATVVGTTVNVAGDVVGGVADTVSGSDKKKDR